MEKEVLMLRHGTTPGNKLCRYIGRTDEPLSAEGIAALSLLHYPTAKRVYVSPMCRCRQTAEILFPGAEQIAVENLREMDFGHFEGRSYKDMEDDAEYRAWIDANCETPIPGGEVKEAFMARCCAAFAETLRHDSAERMVFVVHGGTLMAVLSRYASPAREYYQWSVGNGRGYLLRCDTDTLSMTLLEEY